MTPSHSYKAIWIERARRNQRGVAMMINEEGAFAGWQSRRELFSSASSDLLTAFELLYGDDPNRQVGAFIDRCIAMASKAIRPDQFPALQQSSFYPLNHGVLLRSLAYAQSLQGHAMSGELLREAARAFVEWNSYFEEWDHQNEGDHLSAARMALIAGDLPYARSLLHSRVIHHHPLDAEFLSALVATSPPDERVPGLQAGHRLFATIRNPDYCPQVYMELGIVRFEVAWLLFRARQADGGAPSIEDLIRMISE